MDILLRRDFELAEGRIIYGCQAINILYFLLVKSDVMRRHVKPLWNLRVCLRRVGDEAAAAAEEEDRRSLGGKALTIRSCVRRVGVTPDASVNAEVEPGHRARKSLKAALMAELPDAPSFNVSPTHPALTCWRNVTSLEHLCRFHTGGQRSLGHTYAHTQVVMVLMEAEI